MKTKNYKLDTDKQVLFYEQEFYVLSNFSSFRVTFVGIDFDTAEHAYHYQKFMDGDIRAKVRTARSAHDAFKVARANKRAVNPGWENRKTLIMWNILWEKVNQHEYVMRKLMQTGDRDLIEDSWRDDYWGWGPEKNGRNMLGFLWMRIRSEIIGSGKHERSDRIPETR